MGSLFTRIFLAFWLAALLLVATLLTAQRLYGGDVVHLAQKRLTTDAATAAALWEAGGAPAVERWLRRQERPGRPVLVDGQGRPLFPQHLHRHLKRWLPHPMEPGIHHLAPRHLAVVAPLPQVSPPLYLVAELNPRHLQLLPLWLRLVIAIVIVGVVSLLLSALLTRRVRQLRDAAKALAEGDLAARVQLRARDELAALGRDFNLMAERLDALLSSQRRLVRDVSHELRSPLARLRVALALAERSDRPGQALSRIEKEADELESLIGGLLSLARLESGQGLLAPQPVALHELVRGVVQDAEFEAAAQGRYVEAEALQALEVEGDPVLLRSAVENVVRNAVRHTREAGTVAVRLRRSGSRACLSVRDQGPGVPEPALNLLFEPFARVGEARDRQTGGYGLGLAIAGQTVKAHGGSIRAANHHEGGLEVIIALPLRAAPAREGTEGLGTMDGDHDEG